MAKDKITDYSATNASNTDVGGTGIQGTNAISNFDNAIREIMTHLAETNAGTAPLADTFCVADPADLTKKVRIDAGNVTAGQTRVLRMPDTDITIAAAAASLLGDALSSAHKYKTVNVNSAGTGYEFDRNPFYNVYDYGATGDGTTDDTTAFVACQTAANACEGQISGIRGRGVIVVPTGFFKTSGITTQNDREHWLFLGGRMDASGGAVTVFNCAHGSCVIENGYFLNAFRPTASVGTFAHTKAGSSSADCKFINLKIQGGYYGFYGDGGADSYNFNMTIGNCAADFVYLIRYNGMWAYRGKWDGAYPVQAPVSANFKGAWAGSTAYSVGDVVSSTAGYLYQCRVAGTSAASGGILSSGSTFGDDIPDGAGTLIWRMHRINNSAALKIDSQCFINVFQNCDLTGGHAFAVHTLNSLATTAPQTILFSLCEANIPATVALNLVAADDVQWHGGLIAGGIVSTSIGVKCDVTRGVSIIGAHIRGFTDGVLMTASARKTKIANCMFYANTDCVEAAASASHFSVTGNDMNGSSALWGLNTNGIRIGAGATNYKLLDNDVVDLTGTAVIGHAGSATEISANNA